MVSSVRRPALSISHSPTNVKAKFVSPMPTDAEGKNLFHSAINRLESWKRAHPGSSKNRSIALDLLSTGESGKYCSTSSELGIRPVRSKTRRRKNSKSPTPTFGSRAASARLLSIQ